MLNSKNAIEYFKQDPGFPRFFSLLEYYQDDTFLEYHIDKTIFKVSYKEFVQDVRIKAAKLHAYASNIEKNSFVAIKLPNSPEWPVYFWATLMAGYKPVLVDANLGVAEINYLLKQSLAKAIISNDKLEYDAYLINKNDLNNQMPDMLFKPSWSNEIAFCSSGTTGNQHIYVYDEKAVSLQLLNGEYILTKSKNLMYDKEQGPIKNLAFLPFHHIFGFGAVLMWYSFFGKTIVFPSQMSVNEILYTCQKHGVTHIYSVPAFWNRVAKNIIQLSENSNFIKRSYINKVLTKGFEIQRRKGEKGRIQISKTLARKLQTNLFGNKVKFMISGGDYISTETLRIINSIGYPLNNGFGMTEVGISSVEMDENIEHRILGSIGINFPSYEYKMEFNEIYQSNELLIRGESTYAAEIIDGVVIPHDRNEWLHTGDVVEEGPTGLKIVGRMKDLLFSDSGEKISPSELEKYFTKIPFAKLTSVVGIKNGIYDQLSLIINLNKELSFDEKNMISNAVYAVNQTLLTHQRILKIYITNDDLSQFMLIKPQRLKIVNYINENPNNFEILIPRNDSYILNLEDKSYDEVRQQIRKIFIKVLENENLNIHDDSHFMYDLGGDSLGFYILVNEISALIGIEAVNEELLKCYSVNTFTHLYVKHRKHKKIV